MKLAASLLCLGLTSCFAVTDLDRFQQASASSTTDLAVVWRGMDHHTAQYVEFRVVDSANVIQTRGIFQPLGAAAVSFLVPGGVPALNGPFRLDFWADVDANGVYDSALHTGGADHSWRLPLTDTLLDTTGRYVVSFDHNFSFTDLEAPAAPTSVGKDVTFHVLDVGAFAGKRLELRVADANSGHTVAFFRVPSLAGPTADLVVPGMVEPGSAYRTTVYTDDGNGGAVRAFRVEGVAGAAGLELSFRGSDPLATAGLVEITDKNAIAAP